MKVGLILPTFAERVEPAFELAARAEAAGLDGVFCYDHVWPLGQPERPALAPFPVLAALAVRTGRLALGPLVARIGLVPDDVLVAELLTLRMVAGERLIAGLGTGDRMSARENLAYGVPYPPAGERRRSLVECVTALRRHGVEVWVGGRGTTAEAGRAAGASVNLWAATADEVRAAAAAGPVTWAGPLPAAADLASLLADLAEAGADWAVLAPGVEPEVLAEAGRARPGPPPTGG